MTAAAPSAAVQRPPCELPTSPAPIRVRDVTVIRRAEHDARVLTVSQSPAAGASTDEGPKAHSRGHDGALLHTTNTLGGSRLGHHMGLKQTPITTLSVLFHY